MPAIQGTLLVYTPGSKVLIQDIEVQIVGVCIRENEYVTYEVSWWNGRSREEKWICASEITRNGSFAEALKIGFR